MKSRSKNTNTDTANIGRYCTVEESLIESIKQVKLMREGKLPKKTWNEYLEEQRK